MINQKRLKANNNLSFSLKKVCKNGKIKVIYNTVILLISVMKSKLFIQVSKYLVGVSAAYAAGIIYCILLGWLGRLIYQ